MRRPLFIVSAIVCVFAAACFIVDEDLLAPPLKEDGGLPDGGLPGDSGKPDGSIACVPTAEICNGVDDDCDDVADEAAAADADCETRILNSVTFCDDNKGVCVPIKCNMGFMDCDGQPSNGCEPECECPGAVCDEGDAGADVDAGS